MTLHKSQPWTSELQPISLSTCPSHYLQVQGEQQTSAELREETGFVYKSKSLAENYVQTFFIVSQCMLF